jgi:rhodanese-related sulfurtransferase
MTTNNFPQDFPQTTKRMALLLLAACSVGFAYNAATPLGVRRPATTPPQASPAVLSPNAAYSGQIQNLGVWLKTDGPFSGGATADLTLVAAASKMTWPQTKDLLAQKQIVLVDARTPEYYQTEHIPGAVSLPASSSHAALADFAAHYPKDTTLVVYCASAQCPLAGDLARVLHKKFGYTNVHVLQGGMAEYQRAEELGRPK